MSSKTMASPEPANNVWNLIITLVPWLMLYGTMHTAIYYVFKYFSDSRDAKIDLAVDKRFKIQVEPLEKKIDELTKIVVHHFGELK